jgi:DNA-binding CsgD family transcriptional regulator
LLEQLPLLQLCLVKDHLMRVLICEDGTLLAWVGAFQPEPFSAQQRWLLESIVPDLQRRLALDQLIDETPVTAAALGAILEAMPAAAFIVGESGHIRHANTAGRRWASTHAADLKAAIAESLHGRPEAPLSLTRFTAPDRRPEFLAIAKGPNALLARTAEAAKRWHLTPRQTQVLTLLAQGKANKTIAAELSCALHTVELHVAALLDKGQCDSRSALIAQLWAS